MSEQPSVLDTPEPDASEPGTSELDTPILSTPEPQTPESQSFDAELVLEEIATGEQEAPQVNFDQDYEASKQFEGSASDQASSSSKFDKSAIASSTNSPESSATGNPGDFLEMAKAIAPDPENPSN
jgi:hypothetical protein